MGDAGRAGRGARAGLSGARFEGRVGALLPEVNAATRTVRARIEVANPARCSSPACSRRVAFQRGAKRESVLVPSEAVIRTGSATS